MVSFERAVMEAEVREVEEERGYTRDLKCPRDLLQRFAGGSRLDERPPEPSHSGEVELSLGLSLGGLFGTEPKPKLIRSSSIAAISSMLPREHEFIPTALMRTCSLPTQAEEERRKRKELQSLKRLEAKRKRLEKKNLRISRAEESSSAAGDELKHGGGRLRNAQVSSSLRSLAAATGLPRRTSASPAEQTKNFSPSAGSPGSSSSSKSTEHERPPMQGIDFSESSKRFEPRVLTAMLSTDKSMDLSGEEMDISERRNAAMRAGVEGMPRDGEKLVTDDMPCVSTTGDGPDGRRIEGFLYRYKKGEEVRIVCVCHGKFLTPAEFVRHAGGGDVEHPLRHIVVNPSPPTLC